MATITHRKNWRLSSQETRMNRGPLIRVKHPDGHMTKMYQEDAVEAGLIPARKKAPAPENKMAPVPEDKSAEPTKTEPDDFTTIAGIGPAAARSLAAQGITTFAQLRTENLAGLTLTKRTVAAIEEWRNG